MPVRSQRPFSQACENNRQPILDVLRGEVSGVHVVLEIGSGTGQHARYFAEQLPHLVWQASDLAANLPGIEAWRDGYEGTNLPPPLPLDVTAEDWGEITADAVFTANSLHIMPWSAVCALFRNLPRNVPLNKLLCIYGPFNYNGQYTSESNARFDEWLSANYPGGGIRDVEAVDSLAADAGYSLRADHAMPANNRLLVWQRSVSA